MAHNAGMDAVDKDPLQGLTSEQAARQQALDGPNELGVSQRRTVWDVAWEVVREPMFLLLLGAGGLYLAMGDAYDALVLLGFVLIIMVITVLQERRTDHALEALHDLSSPRALVLREGRVVRVAGREVVVGDLLMLAEGDRVAADAEVLQAHELACDESMLTGESEAVAKAAGEGSRVYAGTLVVQGQGLARVVGTGQHTALGRIGVSLQTIALQSSPLREEMALLTRRLVLIGVALSLLLAGLFWALRGGVLDAALAGITLAMGVLPQELPVVMIVFLALAARRLAAGQILTRRLNAIETLGQTTVLCVDKTGTLTQNRMAVAELCAQGQSLSLAHALVAQVPQPLHALLEYLVLASEIAPHDPMEQAFHRTAAQYLADGHPHPPDWTLEREYELSPALLAMSHLWRKQGSEHDVVACKGAPEAVADLCHLPPEQRASALAQATAMAQRGLRVLAVARAQHPKAQDWPPLQHDFDFEWVGLVGLADPLRAEVPDAIAQCHRAGIRVVMITGDHAHTAQAIAMQAGIHTSGVLTGADMAAMTPENLRDRVADVNVFARVQPQQKLALVEALKARGEVVAMTGDGVNDAPALKAAHIGVAMGQRGTDVAREAAALVLLDDDFSSIVRGIASGRRTFANLRQAMVYIVAVHVPIVGLSLLPVLFGLPLILAPLHIAFLELIIDPTGTLVFEAEEGHASQMAQPPRRTTEPLLSRRHVALGLLQGTSVTAMAMGLYAWVLARGMAPAAATTLAFVALVSANAVLILPSRFAQNSLWRALPRVSMGVLGGTLAALAFVTLFTPLAGAFGFAPLAPWQWLAALGLGMAMLGVFQANKRLLRAR